MKDFALRYGTAFAAHDVHDPRVPDHGHVEFQRVFGTVLERQAWRDCLHCVFLLMVCGPRNRTLRPALASECWTVGGLCCDVIFSASACGPGCGGRRAARRSG